MSNATPQEKLREAFVGVLIGTAVGDALGLPAEGISPQRIQRLWHGQWRHRFFFGRGMISDDTEHTLFVAQALLAHPNDPEAFQRCLAWKLRLWLVGIPAGIGLATLKATINLWLGFPLSRSGVRSAGNGPAMRSAILGAFFANDPTARRRYVAAATRLTHTDPRAETAALAVAEAVAWMVTQNVSQESWLAELPRLGKDDEWQSLCSKMTDAITERRTVAAFAESLGLDRGVTGYAYHSAPIALYAWLRHPGDLRTALESSLNCGGDTDTVGAMVGAICGAAEGRSIAGDWLENLRDWPRSRRVLEQVADRLAEQRLTGQSPGPVAYFWPGLVPRNLVFLVTVLLHGFRRLLPPY
jgi:ADP-ribosyl-[dinitrogen reductase] hydrolase